MPRPGKRPGQVRIGGPTKVTDAEWGRIFNKPKPSAERLVMFPEVRRDPEYCPECGAKLGDK